MAESNSARFKMYTCAICSESFIKIGDYKSHYKTHPHQEPELIKSSSKVIENKVSKRIQKVPVPVYKCPNCSLCFYKSGSYRRHLLSHLDLPAYFCEQCLVGFVQKEQLVSHKKICHFKIKKFYTCAQCPKRFSHRHGLLAHRTEHLVSPPYECPKCPAVFPTASRRARHLAYHTLKCPLCLKPYNTHDALNKHLVNKHPDGDDCDYLSDHTEAESSDSNFSELDIGSESDSCSDEDSKRHVSSRSKRFLSKIANVCFICERRFRKKESLDRHMSSHRIFRCTDCPKFFPKSSELRRHVLEHGL